MANGEGRRAKGTYSFILFAVTCNKQLYTTTALSDLPTARPTPNSLSTLGLAARSLLSTPYIVTTNYSWNPGTHPIAQLRPPNNLAPDRSNTK
jgi:hypothetical protein